MSTNNEHLINPFDSEPEYEDVLNGDSDLYEEGDLYNDVMDGDHDSAMTSIGWGNDEDYNFGCHDGWGDE